MRKLVSVVSVAAMAMAVGASAQTPGYLSDETSGFVSEEQDAAIKGSWIEPAEPFRILGNIHFVGSQNISSYLLTTPEGHILMDTGMPQMHGLVRANIEKLGFQLSDIEIMISSHATWITWAGTRRCRGRPAPALWRGPGCAGAGIRHGHLAGPVSRLARRARGASARRRRHRHTGRHDVRAMLTAGHTPGARRGSPTWRTADACTTSSSRAAGRPTVSARNWQSRPPRCCGNHA